MSIVISEKLPKMEKDKQYKLTELLEKYLMEDLGIYKLKERKFKKSLKKLFEIEAEDLRVNKQGALSWSTKNQELIERLQKEGYSDSFCNRQDIYSFYEHLIFPNKSIV